MAKLNDYELDQIYKEFQAFKPKMLNSDTDPVAYSAMLKANNKPDPRGWTLEEDTAMRDKMEAAGWGSLLPKYQRETPAPQSWGEANNPYLAKMYKTRKTGLTRRGLVRILET